jgi:hypothetical protein
VLIAKCVEILVCEWRSPSDKLISNASQAVLIAFLTDVTLKLFWGHVARGARTINVFDARRRKRSSQAKVSEQRFILRIEKNIFWLHVPMDDLLLMCIGERLSDLTKDSETLMQGQQVGGETLDPAAKGTIRFVFGNQVGESFNDTDIQNGKDIGMFELFEKLAFLQEVFTLLSRSEMRGMENLDGDGTLCQ